MRLSLKTTRQMIVAAKLAALVDKSDPFAYSRMLANLRQGVEQPGEVSEWAAKRLGLQLKEAVRLVA